MIATDRAAWHERRRQGIGASEVAAVLGRHPYASPYSTWCRKVGLVPPDDAGSDAARFGQDVEPLIGKWFHEDTGLWVAGEQMELTHPKQPWARCTVDGLVFEGDHDVCDITDALGVLEKKSGGQPWADGIPEHHHLQVQWQLYVSDLEYGWLAHLCFAFGRLSFKVYEVERDNALLAEIVPQVERFWFDHVVTGDPPPTDGSDATTEALKVVFGEPASDGGAVDFDAELAEVVDWLRQRKADAKRVAEDIAAAENALRAALGERTEGRIRGRLVCSWRPQSRTTVDLERLRADHGDAYDITSTHRVLRLHGRT